MSADGKMNEGRFRVREPAYDAGHRQRLLERFERLGIDGLAEYEVLELLLTFGVPRRDVKPQAKRLLERFKTIKGVLDAPREHLLEVKGVGARSAALLSLCRQLVTGYITAAARRGESICDPQTAGNICRAHLEGLGIERFLGLFLDNQHRLLEVEVIHEGTVNMSAVFPREVMARVLHFQAAALIVAHNHPGGSRNPSAADRQLTSDLHRAAETLGVRLLDHLIVADHEVVSLKDLGYL
ncbi:MAG: DNA repair protein RadC [Deltaproteobacteria bacterium]|nr:DNA repair protein RadC [Candidatus Anaeroferrophillacea bacterium]